MPIVRINYMAPNALPADVLKINGPMIVIDIEPAGVIQSFAQSRGVTLNNVRNVAALIDTGASITAVDKGVLNKLGYPPYGTINLTTAGGTAAVPMYLVKLTLFSNVPSVIARIVLDNISVAAVDLATQQYKALIGRDVLRNILLIYDGAAGQITVTY
ncbi:MAG: aspartyl protease family protein [Vulcanisaeta sp.]